MPERIGKYEVLSELGKGGMGVVYKALDPLLQRLVALKTISAELAQDEPFKRRFYREARAAASLNHPNIVTIYELGEHEGCPFIAMELLEGQGLEKIIRAGLPILLAKKLAILRQVSVALDFAHRRGIVHRDVKPANIMLLPDGTVKVVDFGIARVSASTTQTDHVVGTLNYMSPEQVSGEPVDARSDIFSLGIVLYEFLCYCHPFGTSNSLPAIIMKIVKEDPPPLKQFFPDCPDDLAALVMKALAKLPQNRYPNMEPMLMDLEPILSRTTRETAEQLWTNGKYYFDQQQWAAARSCLEQVIDLDPARTTARTLLDYVRGQLQREAQREQFAPRLQSIRELLQNKQYLEAAAECESVLLVDKSHPQARELLIQARRGLERMRLIQHHLEEAQKLLAEGFLAPAQAEVNKVLGLDPDDRQAQALLVELRSKSEERERHRRLTDGLAQAKEIIEAGDLRAAESRLLEIEREFPGDPEAAKLHAFVQKQLQREELARWTRDRIERAEDLLNRGQHDRALELLESARRQNPLDTGVIDLLARAQEEKARAEAAPPLEKTRIMASPIAPPEAEPSGPPREVAPPPAGQGPTLGVAPPPTRVVMPPPRVEIPPTPRRGGPRQAGPPAPAQPRSVEARAPAQPEVAPPPTPPARPLQLTVAQVKKPDRAAPIKWLLATAMLAGAVVVGYVIYHQWLTAPAVITGRVTDPSGASLAGLKTTLRSAASGESWTAVTDAEGSYRFAGIPPGQYVLQVEAPQGLEAPKPIPVVAVANREQQGDVQLARKAPPILLAALHGRVVDERGRPLRQFQVRYKNQQSESEAVVEGRNGDYEIQELPPGTYSLFAVGARGKRTPKTSVTLEPGQTVRADLALGKPESAPTARGAPQGPAREEAAHAQPGAPAKKSEPGQGEIIPPPPPTTATVAGRVVDSRGFGVRLVTVRLIDSASGASKARATTDSGGNFSFANVKPGMYEISVEPSSFYQPPKSRPHFKVSLGERVNVPQITLPPAS